MDHTCSAPRFRAWQLAPYLWRAECRCGWFRYLTGILVGPPAG